ncbi:Uncharacterised protein [uncultured archaeon]|nr:Uncharacterised protein [uncultured archaeon]
MLGRKVEGAHPVSLVEVRRILEERSAEPDFGYEQQTSLDYARKFAKLTPEDAAKMAKELGEEIPALKGEALAKIIDMLPLHASSITAILAQSRIALSDAQSAKCLDIIAKFRERMVAPPPPPEVPAPQAAAEGAEGSESKPAESGEPASKPSGAAKSESKSK